MIYINYYFRDLELKNGLVDGIFDAPDVEVWCRFLYDMNTKDYIVYESNKPEDEITPLPLFWLDLKFKERGRLNRTECKISY